MHNLNPDRVIAKYQELRSIKRTGFFFGVSHIPILQILKRAGVPRTGKGGRPAARPKAAKAPPPTKEDRFWALVRKSPEVDGCWLWAGSVKKGRKDGYGSFCFAGRSRRAHIVAWELTHGPLAPGKQVLHTCDNRLCVRPDHLFEGTHLDNIRDKLTKGRQQSRRNGWRTLGPEHIKVLAAQLEMGAGELLKLIDDITERRSK